MRLYKFSVKHNELSVRTFSPYTKRKRTDADSQFTVPLFDKPCKVGCHENRFENILAITLTKPIPRFPEIGSYHQY